MDILGIETSCDETAAAVVRDGREVLSNVVYTQIPLHVPYGGVVPEIASRAHVEKISSVMTAALDGRKADAVAVTYGPGLSPALIVGLNAAVFADVGVAVIAILNAMRNLKK
jgi:N6-L-threonylcarbamoyladenine synthase